MRNDAEIYTVRLKFKGFSFTVGVDKEFDPS